MTGRPARAPTLTVSVVLHHSPLARLRQTLASLRRALGEARAAGALGDTTVWLLDNSLDPLYSEAGRGAAAESLDGAPGTEWRYLELDANRGFGAGHNRALLDSDSAYHLVLNPDVELAADALARGLALLAGEPGIVALGPQARGSTGRREYLCKDYPPLFVLLLRGFGPAWLRRRAEGAVARYEMREQCSGDGVTDVPLLSGCCMLLRGRPARLVRGFDTRYFLYFEDFDLSLRLRIHGRLVYAPQVNIVHYGGDAARKGRRHIGWFLRSALRFYRQHGWRWF
jgi:GT2 family glycosyltransferase